MKSTYKGKPWSYGIIAAIIVFMLGTVTMVYILVSQNIEVLYPDYYERTMDYDKTQKQLSYGLEPRFKVEQNWNSTKDSLLFSMPKTDFAQGRIDFIKPNNSQLDTSFTFSVEKGSVFAIPVNALNSGNWHIELAWKADSIQIISRLKLSL